MIYDYNTKNISFIKMAKQLKDKGVKNWNFMLTLYDPKLQGVDPYDPDLSIEMQARIQKEVMINYWYYIREVIRINSTGGAVSYELHLGNMAMHYMQLKNIDVILCLPRQHFKTWSSVVWYSWIYLYQAKNYTIIFSNKQLQDSQENLKRIMDVIEVLPSYLKSHMNPKYDTDNINMLRIAENNNTIKALSSPKDEKSADKLGRGLNIPILWCDEFAFLNMNQVMYMSARPALTKASEAAKNAHQPYGITITTTPNNLDVPEGKFCYDMIQKAAKFTFAFYDWTDDQLRDYLDKNSGNNYVFIEYHHTDLGKDDKWLKAQIRALEGDMAKVKREILIEWTYASNMSIFTEEQLDEMSKYVKHENLQTIYIDNYKIDVLEPFNNLMYKNWCLSIDIGGGLGRDYSAFSLIDPISLKQVMKFKNNNISVLDFANLVIKFVKTYVPNAVIIPERNFNSAFIEYIQKSDFSKNLYYTSTEDKDYTQKKIKKTSIFKAGKTTSVETRRYGFQTDKDTRKYMTEEILFMIANQRPELINNDELFDEIRKLIREKSGKINHMNGEHDDLTMSYLIGLYVLTNTTNRNKFFKNISDKPINEETPKEVNKQEKQFKRIAKYNNQEVMNNIINSNLDRELIEMQKLIDERNNKIETDSKKRHMKNIFSMNGQL